MCEVETQRAKLFYDSLRCDELMTSSFEGLMGDNIWISSNHRAYRLHQLSDGHLTNIILRYLKEEQDVPSCLTEEVLRRKEASIS